MAGVVGKLAVHDQVVDAQQAVLPSVQIGTLRAESLPVLIRDLGFLQKDLGIRIDAVIGLDVLSLSNSSASRRLILRVSVRSRRDHVSIPFVSLRKLRAVSAGIAGRKSVRAMIFWSEAERRERMVKIQFLIGRR